MRAEGATRDESLQQALDRLGTLVAPESLPTAGIVSQAMQRIERRPREAAGAKRIGRWLVCSAVGLAACLLAELAFWQSLPGRLVPPAAVTTANDKPVPSSAPVGSAPVGSAPDDAAPIMRRSTWSTVTESVVLEGDVPVRKLLYSEFERVELLDAQGNTESRLIVPTKAMLVATKEQY
jgi:hypothetical protein